MSKALWNPTAAYRFFPLPNSLSSLPPVLSRAGCHTAWAGVFLCHASLTRRCWWSGQEGQQRNEPLHTFWSSLVDALICLHKPELPTNFTEICWKHSIGSNAKGLQQHGFTSSASLGSQDKNTAAWKIDEQLFLSLKPENNDTKPKITWSNLFCIPKCQH